MLPAKAELRSILDAIAAERGLGVALEATGVLHQAIIEGRIEGTCYWLLSQPPCGCVIGHLAKALGWEGRHQDPPPVPGWRWDAAMDSPIERWVREVHPGETARNSVALHKLDDWVTEWVREQRALPGDVL